MLRGLLDVRQAGDKTARDHGAGDQAARDHDVARTALDGLAHEEDVLRSVPVPLLVGVFVVQVAYADAVESVQLRHGLRDFYNFGGQRRSVDQHLDLTAHKLLRERRDAARDDAALDHDLRAGRDAGHLLLGALHSQWSAGSIVRAAARDSNFCAPFT